MAARAPAEATSGFSLNLRQFLCYFFLIVTFIFLATFCTLVAFFAYEEYSDLYRYSELDIRPPKDDFFQSVGISDAKVTVQVLSAILGKEGTKMFAYLDRDSNGLISAAELEPVLHIVRTNRSHQFNNPAQSCSRDDCLRVLVNVEPLCVGHSCCVFVSSSQLFRNLSHAFCDSSDALENCAEAAAEDTALLEQHFKPIRNDRSRLIDPSHFTAFLPHDDNLKIGDTYPIVDKIDNGPSPFQDAISRFDAYIEPRHRSLAAILNHFHDSGFVLLYPSSQPRSSVGVVRATNAEFMEVQFWLHVEFAGNSSADYVVAPGALRGSLVIRRKDRVPVHFHIRETSQRASFFPNPFAEFLPSGEAVLPRMEMQSVAKLVDIANIAWTEAISIGEAERVLSEALFAKDLPHLLTLSDLRSRRSGTTPPPTVERPLLLFLTVGDLRDVSCRDTCSDLRVIISDPKVREQLRDHHEAAAANWLELQSIAGKEDDFVQNLTLSFVDESPEVLLCVLSSDARSIISWHDLMKEVETRAKTLTPPEPPTETVTDEEEEQRKSNSPIAQLKQHNLDYERRMKPLVAAFLQFLDATLPQS